MTEGRGGAPQLTATVADRGTRSDAGSPPRAGRRRRPKSGWPRVVLVVVLGLVLAVGLVAVWVDHEMNPGSPGPEVTLSLPGGSISSLGSLLASRGVVHQGWVFDLYAKVRGAGSYSSGAYVLKTNDSYSAVLKALGNGPPLVKLTIPEGFTLAQIARRVEKRVPGHSAAGFLATVRSGRVHSPYEPAPGQLEGLLFPDTYVVGLKDTDAMLVQRMVDRFDEVASSVGVDQAASQVGVTPYQAVIVASMVEREAELPQDRGKVARVVYNRLTEGMRLEIDQTVNYGLGRSSGSPSRQDLATPTSYNTYLVYGLPPTAIANPGVASLKAALAPTPGPWLYYVVVLPDGAMAFSTTFSGQEQNIALARSRGLG